jgi:hypothetical protein
MCKMMIDLRSGLLVVAILAASACGEAGAKQLFRCDTGNGTSYQDTPCAKPETQDVIGQFAVEAVPEEEALRWGDQAAEAADLDPRDWPREPAPSRTPAQVREEPQAYRCIASNGAVFYRHDRCPDTVDHGTSVSVHHDRYSGNQVVTSTPTYNSVTSQRVSRKEACKEMESIANRSRRERDKDGAASSYDRNLGRDPCR